MGKYEGAAAYMCVHINKTIELYYVIYHYHYLHYLL